MNYVYGPVPSRRLGQSLGIDPIPLKTCNWNCVYCQLGRTVPMTNTRLEYYPRQEILSEVEQAIDLHKPGEMDWITFVGSGEPTLHVGIGWLIRRVKETTDIPVAVITNGSLLYLPEVRQDLSAADAVMPSLDAGNPLLYRRLNRPWPRLTFDRLVGGLKSFRKEFRGKLWIEVMLVKGFNDTEEALQEIAAALSQVEPDQVHINLPSRPPAEPWVLPVDEEGLMRAARILGEVSIIVHASDGLFDLSGQDSIAEAILSIITRHPIREEELEQALEGWIPERVRELMAQLKASSLAQVVERYGHRYWVSAGARFPERRDVE